MIEPLPCTALRWSCDPTTLKFKTTADVEPVAGVIGQDSAVDALRFGLECHAPGQNVFVRGLSGTGRMTLVKRLLRQIEPKCASKHDRCYVHNFKEQDRPRLLTLPAGRARAFRRRVQELAEFIRDELGTVLAADPLKSHRESLEKRTNEEISSLTDPFEKELKEASLALVPLQVGPVVHMQIFPVVNGKPVPPDEFEQLREQGKVTDAQQTAYEERSEDFHRRLGELTGKIREIRRRYHRAVHAVVEETARAVLGDLARDILTDFPGEDVRLFLSQVVDDVAERRLTGQSEDDPLHTYGVNILIEHNDNDACPVVVENIPTLSNLLGTIDREWGPKGAARSDYSMIRAGSLLQADGGYLIMEARDVLMEPGAWRVLLRTLKHRLLEIVPAEMSWPVLPASLKPEPIPIAVKVILLGDSELFYLLDAYEPDFASLFKVLADFHPEIARGPAGVGQYAGVLARIAGEEGLLPFDRSAVAALAEHGARIAARRGKLTARFSRVADLAREAAFLAKENGAERVAAADVAEAIRRTKARAELPSVRFREFLADGTIKVQTKGEVAGQINGLAVIHAGPLTYGFPARITASVGAGTAGIMNIEGQAQLSGAIHTKGFHILGGCLRTLLHAEHPLAFSASLAFEQSYGGIDGDSASCAEICCLLSALTGIPIRQGVAITGAIDQRGNVEAIGGVNEKIEGFYDTCHDLGLTGTQGVVIPKSNAGDLMLRPDVVEACGKGKFHVWSVERVEQGIELLTGVSAGVADDEGEYPDGTVLGVAREKAREYWLKAIYRPEIELSSDDDEEATDETAAS